MSSTCDGFIRIESYSFGGTGADGPLIPTSSVTLDTNPNNGVFNFTDIVIPTGVTVTLNGGNPATLRATGNVVIDGVLTIPAGQCHQGEGNSPGYAQYAAHTESYDPTYAHLTIGGTRSTHSSGRGGGFVEISAFGSIQIGGAIYADGSQYSAYRGSGGTIVLRTRQPLVILNSGALLARRGGDNHPNGLIRFESAQPPTVLGTCQPSPILATPQRLLGHTYSVSRLTPFELTESDATAVLTTNPIANEGYGVCTTLRGARWVTFPTSNQIHPYGRDGSDLLPNKTYGTGGTPRGIAADRFDRVWVACGVGELRKHSSWGYSMLTVPLPGAPFGVAIDAQDQVWVTCETGNTLHCVAQDGSIVGSYPVGTGPRGIAIDQNGDVWVTLTGGPAAAQGSVAKVDPQGNVLFTVTVDKLPLGIACDAQDRAWVACEGDLIAAGSNVFRISSDGTSVDTLPEGSAPTSIAVAGDGSIWVVNSGNLIAPTSTLEQLDPYSGASVTSHALPDLSIAFGDSTGFQSCLTFDKFGDVDGDGEPNLQEMVFLGDPFDPTKQSQGTTRSIDSVTPVTGMMAGGTSLTITGGPFTYSWASSVTVNGVPASNVQVVDANTITCDTGPIIQQGRGDVVVTDPAGTITAIQAYRYSNVGLFPTPEDGNVAAGSSLTLGVRSHPYTPFWLLAANGIGSHQVIGITLELPTPAITILDPFSYPITIATDGNGRLDLSLAVPAGPALVGQQFSFLAGILDPACLICASNGVVVTVN